MPPRDRPRLADDERRIIEPGWSSEVSDSSRCSSKGRYGITTPTSSRA